MYNDYGWRIALWYTEYYWNLIGRGNLGGGGWGVGVEEGIYYTILVSKRSIE